MIFTDTLLQQRHFAETGKMLNNILTVRLLAVNYTDRQRHGQTDCAFPFWGYMAVHSLRSQPPPPLWPGGSGYHTAHFMALLKFTHK